MSLSYYLIKTEPDVYGWEKFLTDVSGRWDGVRNYSARNHLRQMKRGDLALFYHTGKEKAVVGIAEVKREHYPDPTANGADFSAVDFTPVKALTEPVSLAQIKAEPSLAAMILVRSPRLSVQPVTASEFKQVLRLGKTKL